MTDEEILGKPWQQEPTPKNIKVLFVFLSVDVIGHSRLFTDDMTNRDLLERSRALAALRKYVKAHIGKRRARLLEWDWAGDGGIFAFPAYDPNLPTLDKAFLTAVRIAEGLPEFNRGHDAPDLDVRIVLSQGDAYYYEEKELRHAAALNFAAKLRVPGDRTSITITGDVLKHLGCRSSSKFRRIVMTDPHVHVYGYVPLMIQALDVDVRNTSDRAQSAHLAYRLGVLQYTQGNRGAAARAFSRAIERLEGIEAKHRYFRRTLREFYDLWRTLAADKTIKLLIRGDERHDHLAMLRSDAFKPFQERFRLLLDMELILEQLDVLAGSPVNDPIGLTSLEICLLLERVGYPRRWHGTAIQDRIERLKVELEADEEYAADEGCSICSSVAASCLILNGEDRAVRRLLQWLRGRADKDYCWRRVDRFAGAPSDNHALHYAAMALQAFVDHGRDREAADIKRIVDLFFKDPTAEPEHYPKRWTQYLNTSFYDFSTYVFHAFARYFLAGGQLEDTQKDVLRNALCVLTNRLRDDALNAELDPKEIGRIYPTRENMGSLALDLLLGPETKVDGTILDHNLRRLANYACVDVPATLRNRTLDSNLDRIRKMLEGWLLQIECALYRRDEQGWPIPDYMTETLGIRNS